MRSRDRELITAALCTTDRTRPTKTTHETTHKLQQNTCTDYRVARKNTTTAGRLRTKHPIAVYKINK